MKIEIGKQYKIYNKNKKSVIESEYFKNNEHPGLVEVQICWRTGEYIVTPQDDDEVEELSRFLPEDNEDTFEVTSFVEWELDSTYDGCSEDLYFHGTRLGVFSEEEQEAFTEKYWDYEEGGFQYLEENGWYSTDMEIFIYNGILIEEFKGWEA